MPPTWQSPGSILDSSATLDGLNEALCICFGAFLKENRTRRLPRAYGPRNDTVIVVGCADLYR
jgi:hypothetical protein